MVGVVSAVGLVALLGATAAVTWHRGRRSGALRLALAALASLAAVVAGVRFPSTGAAFPDVALAAVFLVLASSTAPFATIGRTRGAPWAPVVAVGALLAALPAAGGPVVALAALLALVAAAGLFLAGGADRLLARAAASAGPAIGLMLATVTLLAVVEVPPERALALVLLAWAVPMADLVVTSLSRLRHRRPLTGGEGDRMADRLARTGLGTAGARWTVLGAAAATTALGVLASRGRVAPGPGPGLLAGLVVVLAVTVAALRAPAPSGPPPADIPRALRWGAVLVVVVVAAPAGLALATLWTARAPALAGEQAATQALSLARQGHLTQAADRFTAARADFAEADHRLDSPLATLGLGYPVLSSNLAAIRTLGTVGVSLADKGQQLSLASDRFRYGIRGGTVPVAQLAATAPQFRSALTTVDDAQAAMAGIRGPYLVTPVTHALDTLERQLAPARIDVVRASGIADNLPAMLGLDGTRRYFLAFQTDAEARATGGLIGLDGTLVADRGHLQLTGLEDTGSLNQGGAPVRVLHAPADYVARYGSFEPAYNWQMVNLSPDFPTVGAVIAGLYPQSGGTPVDGVLALDPQGLAAMLTVTGPVTVAGWPVPISSANVSAVTQHQSYITYAGADAARRAFLEQLVRTVFDRLSNLDLHDPVTLVDALAPAVRAGHLMAYATRAPEQAYLASVGMAGGVPPVVSDALQLTTQNAAANKIDWYLHRTVTDRVHLTPVTTAGGSSPAAAHVSARVTVSLDNTAPASGLPPEVIGPGGPGFVAGQNRTFLTLYTPLQFFGATLDGSPTGLSSLPELGRRADSTFVDVGAGQTATLSTNLSGTVHLLPGGWYGLDLPSQPLINPDHVHVVVTVAPGWKITGVRSATRVGPGRAEATLVTASQHTVWVQVAPTR